MQINVALDLIMMDLNETQSNFAFDKSIRHIAEIFFKGIDKQSDS